MFARFFLSALVVGLFASFSVVAPATAKTSQSYYSSQKKPKKKYLKNRKKNKLSKAQKPAQ